MNIWPIKPVHPWQFRENSGIFTGGEGHPSPLGHEQEASQFERAWARSSFGIKVAHE